MLIYEGKGKSKVLIKFLLNFRQSGDVLFFLNARRLRGYTATGTLSKKQATESANGGDNGSWNCSLWNDLE